MRVVLRHAGIGLYYAGRKHWVGNADSARDLETIERAAELGREESFGDMDIVVTSDDPNGVPVLPLRRKREADDDTLRDAAYTPGRWHPSRSPRPVEQSIAAAPTIIIRLALGPR